MRCGEWLQAASEARAREVKYGAEKEVRSLGWRRRAEPEKRVEMMGDRRLWNFGR